MSICVFNSFKAACNKAFFGINHNRDQAACFFLAFTKKIKLFGNKMNLPNEVNVTTLNFPSNVLDFPYLDVYSFATLIKVQVHVLHFQRLHTNLVFSSGHFFSLDLTYMRTFCGARAIG